MFVTPAKNMGIIENSNQKTIFTPVHDSHLRTAYKMFQDKPIFGHGPKMFRIKCSIPNIQQDKNHVVLILIIFIYNY